MICEGLKEAFESGVEVNCSDGYTRMIAPLVAAWLGDREEHEIIAGVVKVGEVKAGFIVLLTINGSTFKRGRIVKHIWFDLTE